MGPKLSLVLMLCMWASLQAEMIRFDKYKVYRVLPTSRTQLAALRNIGLNNTEVSFWKDPSHVNAPADIMVAPKHVSYLKKYLKKLDLTPKLLIKNVQKLIDDQKQQTNSKNYAFNWNQYHRIDVINSWMDGLADRYPDVVKIIIAGTSYEDRDIMGVKISFKPNNAAVFIESGIHAREWIAPATATFVINHLLFSNDPGVRDIAESFDWYIFPSVNPDGYEYTHTVNRIWRKTRSPGPFPGCEGADANRNFGFHWMENGASRNPCYETYGGSAAFSEPESRNLANYIKSIGSKIKIYLSFHAYSQLLLIPYGFTAQHVSNYQQMMQIGTKAMQSLARRYGTEYIVGNIVDILYEASGSSLDWVKGTLNVPVTYVYELRDQGTYGFMLPANQIVPTGLETLDSLVTLVQEAKKIL